MLYKKAEVIIIYTFKHLVTKLVIRNSRNQSRAGYRMAMMRSRGGGGVFEDFKPTSEEWRQDHQSHILTIYLPAGFMKEQIKVSTEGRNMIRIRGERPVIAGNKWSRFLEDFEVPENSEMNSVRAKYEGGTLTITVPKQITDHIPPQNIHEKFLPDDKSLQPQKTPRYELNEKHIIASKRADDTTIKNNYERRNKLPEDHESTADMMKLEKHDGNTTTTSKIDKESKLGKQIKESSGSDYKAFTMGKYYKKAMKGLSELNEERQLLVNMGAAVLVIVSLGAYVTYKSVSRKDKN
ncbi:hypothetical protein BUALT_Bualt01G0147200 [Buddleja alternifolia]|uniref:SHSP domain-containing protein n=1 Tax=Buddleja alternifolia TaxID=168488 RepID=A0AAV6Y7A0_9LAMI|nr:hypothetical protein BUALT_Bualt01G0147200 [Buddleja alternifolia]